jgi:sugar lactone lactonase YvrE
VNARTETLVDGLGFPEGPRWHDGRLWFSDFHHRVVRSVGLEGDLRVELQLDDVPSGLGWDPHGRLLVVSMLQRSLLRVDGATTEVVADLAPWTVMGANDMAVDSRGRAYIGNFGYDFMAGEEPRPTALLLVDEEGKTGPVTPLELVCPNGIIVDERARTVIVAETFTHRLTAYDLADDGTLVGGRLFAQFDAGVDPDGICLDASGQVWLATATNPEVLRVADGGEVTARVQLSSGLTSYAVALDDDGDTLLVCSAPGLMPTDPGGGRIEVADLTKE